VLEDLYTTLDANRMLGTADHDGRPWPRQEDRKAASQASPSVREGSWGCTA